MKKNLFFCFMTLIAGVSVLTSCGSQKTVIAPAVQSQIKTQKSLEGDWVTVETTQLQGRDWVDDLSEDGLSMVKVSYRWYAGIGEADDKQTAIEIAEREARANIARIIGTKVKTDAEDRALANDGDVRKTIKLHWKQESESLQNACEPFGGTKIEYNSSTKMYKATVKVGIRDDRFQKMLNNAGNYKPSNLSGKDLEDFIKMNKSIMNAIQGN